MVGDDVAGLAVHIAARVMGAAAAGRACSSSSTVHDLVVGSGLRFEDRGRRELRGVPGEWGLWEVVRDELRARRGRGGAARAARDGRARRATARAASGASARSPSGPAGSPARLARSSASRRGDVVLTLLGNRPEWVLAMVACFRQGYVVLPCTEQLRAKDLQAAARASHSRALVIADERNRDGARGGRLGRADGVGAVGRLAAPRAAAPRRARARRPVPDHVHLRHVRRAEGRRCTASATCPASGSRPSTGWPREPGDLVWCTAASGWSKSARNAFIAPWLRGAAALLHDARFDPAERLEHRRARGRERPLHGADGVPRDRQARRAAAASRRCAGWSRPARRSTPACSAPGTRRPACGSATATGRPRPASSPATRRASRRAPGSMGRPLPGVGLSVVDGELVLDPATDPTFFLRYLGDEPHAGPWRTGDLVRADEDGFLFFEGRTDDVIVSAGYRIGPFEVESALVAPPGRRRRGRRGRPRPGARQRRARDRRPPRRPRGLATRSPASSRTTSRPRPRRTSTRGSSSSPRSCRAPTAGRSAAPSCARRRAG